MLISADYIYADGALRPDMAIETDGLTITALRPLGRDTADQHHHLIMPACTDLQVNGGGGVMLNSTPTPDGIRAIRDAHARLGTGAILPTVITDTPDIMESAADAIIACMGEAGILGIHIEGPHINPVRKGTHNADYIRPLDDRTMAVLRRLRAADVPVLLTLAPEETDLALIRAAADLGVVVSAGHTMATADQARQGMANGVTMFTHLFNAMPQMSSRDPGVIAAAILSDAWCGIIADGIHVDWDMLRIALAARPRDDRTFIVSDAMATVGGPDHFNLYGADIYVRDGRLVNAAGSLAGAHIDMVTSLANLHRHAGVPLDRAIFMATDAPRAAMGLPGLSVAAGTALRDVIGLDGDLRLVSVV
ncbi:N-acetylglucosamine-6-phosphate deacetylase [Paracoccus sp. (in: a-proteobacteria)]|uniref:N-acetylglucosamine-6-phosphate deacetylase n=1 Tax=Paracoccus sp. TaxID=267 RepID=UPI0026DEA706|nr:N-acetylglucosamine-6-phosphate deacetylase [Paracoccus sp. (in: a-proteobacteria)]MDO5646984.1 N-acetylglucosamine-6-phosphate deacetylase [Paracoccus sp. (in: a-proteobacteria)]